MTNHVLNRDIRPPRIVGAWDALNDVEVAHDGKMYWAVLEYYEDGEEIRARSITGYDLTPEVAWEVVRSRNEALGLEQDSIGFWYRP